MSEIKVRILDSDPSHAELFEHFFAQDGIEIQFMANLDDLLNLLKEAQQLFLLIDYKSIVDAERAQVINFFKMLGEHTAIVYEAPENAVRRMAFYELGASRVYDTSNSLEEIYFSIRWFYKSSFKEKRPAKIYSRGKIEDVPLTTLINTLGREKRTGILKIVTTNNSGKFVFHNGNIDDAQVGFFTGEAAVLHMLFWKKGQFTFTATQSQNPMNKIKLSNIGLMIQAESYREKFIENINQLGPLLSVIRIRNIGDLAYSGPDINKEFIEYLQTPRPVEELLENPYYSNLETAEKLVWLQNYNFLNINEPRKSSDMDSALEEAAPETIRKSISFDDSEIKDLKHNLAISGKETGKLLTLSPDPDKSKTLIRLIVGSKKSIRNDRDLYVAKAQLTEAFGLLLFGSGMNQKVLDTLENISDGLNGYIVLLESKNEDQFEYNNYFINQLNGLLPLPGVVAAMDIGSKEELDKMKSKFPSPFSINWVACDCNDAESVKDMLLSIRPIIKTEKIPNPKETSL